MKTLIRTVAAVTALVAAPAAMAADAIVDVPQPPIAAPAPTFTWTGAYVGVQGGYSDYFADGRPALNRSVDADGFVGGVHAGYNFQFDNGTGNGFVVGAYADVDFGGIDIDLGSAGPGGGVNSRINGVGEVDYVARGMVKAGYGFGRALGYVQGGVNYISGEIDVSPVAATRAGFPGLAGRSADVDSFGYSVGAGVDFAVTNNIVVGGDYLYESFGTGDGLVNDPAFPALVNRDIDLDGHTFRAKLSYKF